MPLRRLVDGIRHCVLDRLDGAKVSNHRVEIAVGHDLVEPARHDHRDWHAIALDTLAQHLLELGICVVADSGFVILRNVRRGHFERRLVPAQTTGKRLVHDLAGRPLWRVAITAGENAVDQIIAALHQIGLCVRDTIRGGQNHNERRNETEHPVPPIMLSAIIHSRYAATIPRTCTAISLKAYHRPQLCDLLAANTSTYVRCRPLFLAQSMADALVGSGFTDRLTMV